MLLVVLLAGAAPAGVGNNCEICGGPFAKTYYVVEDLVRQTKKHICEACSKSKTVCAACDLAVVPKTMVKLEDGRILCELDAKGAILSEELARDIFQEVKREAQQILVHWPPLPDRNITVELVNRDQFVKEYRRRPGIEDPEKLLGLTRSRTKDETNFEHHIYLLNGVLRPQFEATCAHEYVHTWLNEHEKRGRKLDKDSEEGVCELISYKYLAARTQTNEMNRILASSYTRGQIEALVAVEQKYPFHRLVAWIHEGVDSWLDKDKLERVLELKKAVAPPTEDFAWAPNVPVPVPDKLVLKGISGGAARRFALINDRTFGKDEELKVRVGTSNVVVRCLEVREKSVLIRVKGQNDATELFLRGARP